VPETLCDQVRLTVRLSDLDKAITFGCGALALCPQLHPDWFMSLDILASTLITRFKETNILVDLDESITFLREASTLRPAHHAVTKLWESLFIRFREFWILAVLSKCQTTWLMKLEI